MLDVKNIKMNEVNKMDEEISSVPKTGQELVEEHTKEVPAKMPSKAKIDRKQQLKDLANLDIQKPVTARMRKRYKEIQVLSKAVSSKVMKGLHPVWTTVNPEMFISGLRLTTRNGIGTITYHRYELDEKGNKKYYPQMGMVRGEEVEVGGSYKHECLVVETIEYMKPLKVEEITEFI